MITTPREAAEFWKKKLGEDKWKNTPPDKQLEMIDQLLSVPQDAKFHIIGADSVVQPPIVKAVRLTEENDNKITTPKVQIPYQNMFQWASELTSELTVSSVDFYWTPKMKGLLRRLQTLENQFIAVIGLQGVGKTAFHYQLSRELSGDDPGSVYSFKWGNFDLLTYAEDHLAFDIKKALEIEYSMAYSGENLPYMVTRFNAENQRFCIRELRKKLGKKAEPIIKQTILANMAESKAVLIDLPDYSKNNQGQLHADLREIHQMWESLRLVEAEWKTNMVFFVQKELYKDHFFFGKPILFELEPLEPQQLVEFFNQKFKGYGPFKEAAILRIAVLSRGIWRRFKKYIDISLQNWYGLENPNKPINIQDVDQWVGLDQLVRDMNLELQDLFPRAKEKQRAAVILLQYLQQHKVVKQSELTLHIFGSGKAAEMACSRLLDKLEAYGYVERNLEGRDKTVKLKGVVA
jgi:hypothetical protein